MSSVRFRRYVVWAIIGVLVAQPLAPSALLALTSGPTQPEFSTFEPVSTDKTVDPFTGQFTYNIPTISIPGPDGSGYALSLSYHSGSTGEDDASWVGKGWTLSPGAIVRNKQVFPDDFNHAPITQVNHGITNWSISVTKSIGAEVFSREIPNLNVGGAITTRYSNQSGYHHLANASLSLLGIGNVGYTVNDAEATVYAPLVAPGQILAQVANAGASALVSAIAGKEVAVNSFHNLSLSRSPDFLGMTLRDASFGVNFPEYDGTILTGEVAVTGNVVGLAGVKGGVKGTYAKSVSKDVATTACGYMYSSNATANDEMDYRVEKEAQYNSRDRYLGIPFSGADNFVVMGEGISGSFRLRQSSVGQFRPRARHTGDASEDISIQGQIAASVGFGTEWTRGRHTLDIGGWDPEEEDGGGFGFDRRGVVDESSFFRYHGDLGGSVEYQSTDAPVTTNLPAVDVANPFIEYNYRFINYGVNPRMLQSGRAGRSMFVGYHTNGEMAVHSFVQCYNGDGPSFVKSYNKADSSRRFVDRSDKAIADGIGEFLVTNPGGTRYVFGLPVFSRNEHDLQYLIDGATTTDGVIASRRCDLHDLSIPNQRVTGQIRPAPYASMFLLTEITTPDYVDRTNDGPSADDLGGYTKFNYTRAAGTDRKSQPGTSAEWYKWRVPYRGLLYNRGSLSDPNDDAGSVSYGEKEVYYLRSVETKTHIAFFRTSPRDDGYEADASEGDASANGAYSLPTTNKLQKLDSICLYSKNPDGSLGKLVQMVHLDYTYELWPGTPNARQTQANPNRGVLTLKRVYSEYDGAVNARISPYVFGYTYRRAADYNAPVPSIYPAPVAYANVFSAGAETPQYAVANVDRWGYYRTDGASRALIQNSWIDQKPNAAFDPAAGQLKWIHLPSGGEIHVQYEQNEYAYVQDAPAMAMVRLKNAPGHSVIDDGNTTAMYLNLDDLGIAGNSSAIDALVGAIRKRFVPTAGAPEKERMLFRFLYALQGDQPNLANCASEYISGYLHLQDVARQGNEVLVTLKAAGNGDLFQKTFEHPQDVARRFYATQRSGILDPRGICDASITALKPREEDSKGSIFGTLLLSFNNRFYTASEVARKVDLANSYLRVPMVTPKKGGGIRVRRLLTYDRGNPGAPDGTGMLYGTEYLYRNADGTCSGVATNEPDAGREENALVGFLEKRDPQDMLTRVVAGTDMEQFEGPLGESLLPAPSIGYRRVVTRNIHAGATNTGYAVYEYFTAYDYPMNKSYVVPPSQRYPLPVATEIASIDQYAEGEVGTVKGVIDNAYRTQGFSFVLNAMHGRPRKIAAYGGDPADVSGAAEPVSATEYEYFEPGEAVPIRRGVTDDGASTARLGREQEVVMENRKVVDVTWKDGTTSDFALSLATFVPFPLFGYYSEVGWEQHSIRMQTTTKVVRYPAIVKAVTTVSNGASKRVENVAFDPETGTAVAMRSSDGHDGLLLAGASTPHVGAYYNYSIPAAWQYPTMGQVAHGEGRLIDDGPGVTIEKWYDTDHYLNFTFALPSLVPSTIGALVSGDMVVLTGDAYPGSEEKGAYLGMYYVGAIAGNQVQLLPTYVSNTSTAAVIRVHRIEVLRTARTNQLGVSIGSITTYGAAFSVIPVPMQ